PRQRPRLRHRPKKAVLTDKHIVPDGDSLRPANRPRLFDDQISRTVRETNRTEFSANLSIGAFKKLHHFHLCWFRDYVRTAPCVPRQIFTHAFTLRRNIFSIALPSRRPKAASPPGATIIRLSTE